MEQQLKKTEAVISLEDGAKRLLHWLECYPFQRAQDIILALSPWEKRTTVYRHLAELERLHLIEGLHVGIVQRKRLYHLSPLGSWVCDHLAFQRNQEDQEKRARWERWSWQGAGPVVREEREKFVRLLPRLPIFLLLQESVNSLVSNAGTALTSQGRHARLIQWSWLRDYGHTFASPREQTLRLHVEGALTICLHFSQEETPSRAALQANPLENWYTMFLLHCPLDDVRLMRARLDRLLRWRESMERTSVYSQMPPLLILASTERQAEWWHQAAMHVASQLRVDPPLGAITCLPRAGEPFPNLWLLAFRQLGTKALCHVQDLVHSWPAPSVPELLAWRGEAGNSGTEERGTQKKHDLKLAFPRRLRSISYGLARIPQKGQFVLAEARRLGKATHDYRVPSVSLTRRHWEILHLCFAHPFLSCENLTHLLLLSRTTTHLLLADLHHAGYLAGIDTPVGERWQLTEAGLRLQARLAFCHVHRLVRFPREEGQPLIQRGVIGLLHQIRHTAGIYTFFSLLSSSLATRPDASLRWWETGVLSERHFQFREKVYRFRPDALAAVQWGPRTFRFWLEWDRGTMTSKDLLLKFTTYAMYLASREWASSSPHLPALLCVTPDIQQENQLLKAALQRLMQVPAGFCMYTTTAPLLLTQGILGPIWRRVELQKPPTEPAPVEYPSRIALFTEGGDSL